MFLIDNDNVIVFTTNTVVRTVICQFSSHLRFSGLRHCSFGFCDISPLTIQHVVKMHRICTSIALMTSCVYMNLVASIWLFISMIPCKVVLAILIWPNWDTHFFNFFTTTWNIGYDYIKTIRRLVADGQFSSHLRFSGLRHCSFSFCDIGSLTIQHIVKMHRICTSIALMAGCVDMNLVTSVWLFVGMIPSEIILTILIWPDWDTDFFNFFATTWNIGYNNIKTIRGLIADGQFPCHLGFCRLRDCSFSFCNIGSLAV